MKRSASPRSCEPRPKSATRRLREVNASLTKATDYYIKHACPAGGKRTFKEATAEVLEAKRRSNKKQSYIKGLGWSLGVFNQDFGDMLVNDLTLKEFSDWLDAMEWEPITKRGYVRDVSIVINHCVKYNYCAENPLKKMEEITLDESEPEVFTIEQAIEVMAMCEAHPELELTATFALQFFTGERTCEARLQDWADVKLGGFVTVRGRSSKTRKTRNIKAMDNLTEWLSPYAGLHGRIAPPNYWARRKQLKALLGWEHWPKNGCRHSFGSYLYAQTEDSTYVAAQLGHTGDQMLFEHYRRLVDPADGPRFFEIRPQFRLVPRLETKVA
ncbi:MAG: tyrosine-type recombinase/integrase [Verrucomicrobiota bacterium]